MFHHPTGRSPSGHMTHGTTPLLDNLRRPAVTYRSAVRLVLLSSTPPTPSARARSVDTRPRKSASQAAARMSASASSVSSSFGWPTARAAGWLSARPTSCGRKRGIAAGPCSRSSEACRARTASGAVRGGANPMTMAQGPTQTRGCWPPTLAAPIDLVATGLVSQEGGPVTRFPHQVAGPYASVPQGLSLCRGVSDTATCHFLNYLASKTWPSWIPLDATRGLPRWAYRPRPLA